jgi:hypothetical protein
MSLTPAATVTLGPLRYNFHVAEVSVRLATLPGVNACTITVPAGVELEAAPGDAGIVELDGGEEPATVISGKVRSLQRGVLGTQVVVADGSADLAALRPAATYERQAARDVVRALCHEAGVTTTLDLDLSLAAYVAHQALTAAEHIALLAHLAGALATVDGSGELQVRPVPSGAPDHALLYGREIVSYEVTGAVRPGPQGQRVVVGNGPAGSAGAPDALRHSPTVLPGDAPEPGGGALWMPMPVLRTPAAARAASQAAERRAAAAGSRLQARCFLLPHLRPGTVVEVQGLPDGLSGGPWLVTHVRHQLDPRTGGATVLHGVSAGAAGPGGLLGAALSAAGGLL